MEVFENPQSQPSLARMHRIVLPEGEEPSYPPSSKTNCERDRM